MRISLLAFFLLLGLTVVLIGRYPHICLRIGAQAAESGDTEKAVQWLSRACNIARREETRQEAKALLSKVKDQEIDRLIEEKWYEEALAALSDGTGSDLTDDRVLLCRYEIARQCMLTGNYSEAEKQFSGILTYRDAAEQYQECGNHIAALAFESGDLQTVCDYIAKNPLDPAMQELNEKVLKIQADEQLQSDDPEAGLKIILELWQKGKAEDADLIRAERISYPYLFENKNDDEVLEAARAINTEQVKKRNELLEKRNQLPKHVLAVGNLHTIALRKDGTVLAAGDHSYGQCDVDGWKDIAAVAAGAFHTVGLRKDGTVITTGDNRFGQCETGDIRGAVEIDAHGFDTIVRLEDGSIRCFGAHDYGPHTYGWTDIRDLSAGGYALTGITEDGTAVATSDSYLNRDFQNLIAIDAATTYAAGITADGRLVTSSLFDAPWENVVDINATANGIMGLMTDGTIRLIQIGTMDASSILTRSDIIAIAYSGTHAAVLLQDGTYLACGENGAGQCDVSDWQWNG